MSTKKFGGKAASPDVHSVAEAVSHSRTARTDAPGKGRQAVTTACCTVWWSTLRSPPPVANHHLWVHLVDHGLHRLHHLQKLETVHPIVWEPQMPNV
jgi:hypothetical protein